MKNEVEEIRNVIDAIDNEFIILLQKRADLAVQMGALKHANGAQTFDPVREGSIIDRLSMMIKPPLTRDMLSSVMHVVFSISRSLQARKSIAYLGPDGSYSHEAAALIFPCDAILIPQPSIEAVIEAVVAGRADMGIAPVENSTEGMVSQTLDLMVSSRLSVVREILLPIRHCLISQTTMDKITRVFSHPQALAQCRGWLKANLPGAATITTASTSDAALTTAANPNSAAIASEQAARLYGVPVLAANISDSSDNITRFWVLSRTMIAAPTHAKTSLILTLENKPGSLFHALGAFAEKGINLTKIESRPSRKDPWEYIFFIDFQGSLVEERVQKTMEIIKAHTREIIVLGSYPESGVGE
ncbi:MAG: prephenate dehydratase [Syntrophaceae bacterium]